MMSPWLQADPVVALSSSTNLAPAQEVSTFLIPTAVESFSSAHVFCPVFLPVSFRSRRIAFLHSPVSLTRSESRGKDTPFSPFLEVPEFFFSGQRPVRMLHRVRFFIFPSPRPVVFFDPEDDETADPPQFVRLGSVTLSRCPLPFFFISDRANPDLR